MTSPKDPLVRVSVSDGVGFLELNRPHRANAYDRPTLESMEQGLATLAGADEVRAVVISSSTPGKFCGGADLSEVRRREASDALELYSLKVFDAVAACPRPTIAAVDGPAYGGGLELALACDLRISSDRARFALPEISLGILPAAGGTFRLPRTVGQARARQMILFGQQIDAQQALTWGLVSEVVPPGQLARQTLRWARAAAGLDPLALELAKRCLDAADHSDEGRQRVRCAQAALYARQDRQRGSIARPTDARDPGKDKEESES